jgi:dockerin type I repeat protein/PEP-CTERM motif-containing protein
MKLITRFLVGVLACASVCWTAPLASAAAINAGMHTLAPNMPGQQVQIHVTGGEAVSGIDLFVQVGDGGVTVGGDDTGPKITNLDLVTGTIFAANHTDIFTDPAPLIWGATTTTNSGTVAANGVLVTLTIDTTGITTGQFDLILNPPATGPTAFADTGVVANLTNGSLQIGAAPTLTGDYNGNSIVDAADYVLWRKTLNQTGAGLAADGNGNNQVDAADYQVWRTNFGKTAALGANYTAVPEPASIALLAVGAVLVVRRVR